MTYSQIAEYVGNKKLSRIIRSILHNNPDENKYPCYIVVDSKGNLLKHFFFGEIETLEKDGIIVINYKINLDKYKVQENQIYRRII